jgi:O-antigen ligase
LAGAATLALASGPRGRRLVIAGAVIIAALVALAVLGALPTALATRILSIGALLQPPDPASVAITAENFAILERLAQLRAGTGMAIAHPWLGVGPGNFSAAYPYHAVAPWLISRGHAHNAYITIAAEVGLIGLIAYLGLIGSTLWRLMRALTHIRGTLARGIILGCCGMIASVAVHQLFEHAHVLNLTVVYAAVLGLAEAALRHDRGANGDEERQSCGFW